MREGTRRPWALIVCVATTWAGVAAAAGVAQPEGPTTPPPAGEPGGPEGGAGGEAGVLPTPVEEVEAVVHFKDGRRMVGFLVSEDEEEVVIRIDRIRTPIPMAEVDRVERLAPIAERYAQLRATIDRKDTDRLVLLVEWLFARKQYALALEELEHILSVDPAHAKAKNLRTLVTQQAELERLGRGGAGVGAGVSRPAGRAAFPVLSAEEVNLIRVFQVDLERPPRMVIPREVVTELIERYKDRKEIPSTEEGRASLYRRQPAQIVRLMFELKARELYGKVQVQEEPRSMRLFRENVARGWLVNGCATSRCHGGEEAGRLWLSNRRTNADATIYTNFYILHEYRLSDGTPLIDYERPAESPLLQMGLRPEVSKRPHPRVQALGGSEPFKPAFMSVEDRRFQEAVEWIRSMQVPEGRSYPIGYVPPVPSGLPEGTSPSEPPSR